MVAGIGAGRPRTTDDLDRQARAHGRRKLALVEKAKRLEKVENNQPLGSQIKAEAGGQQNDMGKMMFGLMFLALMGSMFQNHHQQPQMHQPVVMQAPVPMIQQPVLPQQQMMVQPSPVVVSQPVVQSQPQSSNNPMSMIMNTMMSLVLTSMMQNMVSGFASGSQNGQTGGNIGNNNIFPSMGNIIGGMMGSNSNNSTVKTSGDFMDMADMHAAEADALRDQANAVRREKGHDEKDYSKEADLKKEDEKPKEPKFVFTPPYDPTRNMVRKEKPAA